MIKFQIASDLHIEYKNNNVPDPLLYITPTAENLILAGDIGSFYKLNQLKNFLIKLCKYFNTVIYIPGNHEYYKQPEYKNLSMNILFKRFENEVKKSIANLYILNKSSLKLNNICVVGCTLWSRPKIYVPSFIVRIHGMNSSKYKKYFEENLKYINNMILYCKRKKLKMVLVTHHVPSFSLLVNSGKKDKFSSLYASDLEYLLSKNKIHTWICGHIHKNFNLITKEGTLLIGNQKGKPKDKIKDYNKKLVIKIN